MVAHEVRHLPVPASTTFLPTLGPAPITVSVPIAWHDINGSPTDLGDEAASPSVIASPEIEAYNTTWTTPGMEFLASPTLTQFSSDELLDIAAPNILGSFSITV